MKKWVPSVFLIIGIVCLIITGALWHNEVEPRKIVIDNSVSLTSCAISGLIMHEQLCPVKNNLGQTCMYVMPMYSFSYGSEVWTNILESDIVPDVYENSNVNDTVFITRQYQDVQGQWFAADCYAQINTDDQHNGVLDVATLTLNAPDKATYNNWKDVMAFFFAVAALTIVLSIVFCVRVRRQKTLDIPS